MSSDSPRDKSCEERSQTYSDPREVITLPPPSPLGSLHSASTHASLHTFHLREKGRKHTCLIILTSLGLLLLLLALLTYFLFPRPPIFVIVSTSYSIINASPAALQISLTSTVQCDNTQSFMPWSVVNLKARIFTLYSNSPVVTTSSAKVSIPARTSRVFTLSMSLDSSSVSNPVAALSCSQAIVSSGVCYASVEVFGTPVYLGISLPLKSFTSPVEIKA